MDNLHLYNELYKVLRMEDHFCTDAGELIKSNIETAALNINPELIRLLLNNELLSRHFFADVDGVKVFDKVKFQRFIMNKQFLPDSYTSFKNKIGLTTDDGRFITDSREVVLSWPFKDCMLEGGQTKEDAKRDEVFWNETLAPDEINRLTEPKAFTSFKRYDKDGEHEVEHLLPTDNLIIKGNNLLALYSLKKRFVNSIKLIYIDVPFNTENDSFQYNDNFTHSTWLTFMKDRLSIAYELLCAGGSIFIECDKNEVAYLKVLCDSLFLRDNFVSDITVQTSYANGLKVSQKEKTILKMKDTILVYKKGELTIKPQYIEKKYWDTHYNSIFRKMPNGEFHLESLKEELVKQGIIKANETIKKETINKDKFFEYVCRNKDIICCLNPIHSDGEIKEAAKQSNGKVVKFETSRGNIQYLYNGRQIGFFNQCFHNVNGEEKLSVLLGDLWNDIDFGNTQNEGGVTFPNGKKPEMLLYRIIDMMTKEGDWVMDFHLGSGTTAAVAHKMKRNYIGCEQIDAQIEMSLKRMQNVINGDPSAASKVANWQGGGSFVYCELSKANQNFVEKIEAATTKDALATIWQQMQETGFLSYKIKAKDIDENAEAFEALCLNDQKRFLIECLDKNLLYVPLSDIDNADYNVSDEDKRLTRELYKKGV